MLEIEFHQSHSIWEIHSLRIKEELKTDFTLNIVTRVDFARFCSSHSYTL